MHCRTFTSFYWLGSEVERVVFEASTVRRALEVHYECGWSAFDDRRLVAGEVATADAHQHARLVANESWGEDE